MAPNRSPVRPYSTLTKLTLGALLINMLAYASEFIWLGFDLQVGIVVGVLIVASVLISMGWRWTAALGALLAGGIMLGNPYLLHNLSLPISSGFFLAALTQVTSGLVVVVAGIGATVQSYWSGHKEGR